MLGSAASLRPQLLPKVLSFQRVAGKAHGTQGAGAETGRDSVSFVATRTFWSEETVKQHDTELGDSTPGLKERKELLHSWRVGKELEGGLMTGWTG